MKRTALCFIMMSFVYILTAQVVYERNDFAHVNDEYPLAKYSNSDPASGMAVSSFGELNEMLFSDFTFEQCILDTLRFYSPGEFDTENIYPNANCAYINEIGYVVYLRITWPQVEVVGMQGEIPMLGGPANLKAEQNLFTLRFPLSPGCNLMETGNMSQQFHISTFAEIIPSEYYDIVVAMYDSVKFAITLDQTSEFDNDGYLTIDDTNSFNDSRFILREFRYEKQTTNVYLHAIYNGQWTPLQDAPLIGDQLPVELPMIDSSYTINYWAKYLGTPLVSMKTSPDYLTAYSVTLFDGEFAGISPVESEIWSVYPNPATDYVYFKNEKQNPAHIKIFSLDGKLVLDIDFNADIYIFDAQNLSQGMYFYELSNDNNANKTSGKFQVVK